MLEDRSIASNHGIESDHRLSLLTALEDAWDTPCQADSWESIIPIRQRRWHAAAMLLSYDDDHGTWLEQTTLRLLLQSKTKCPT